MKNSPKFLAAAVAAIALFFSTNVNAQSSKFGIGVNAGFATNNGSSYAIGADLRYQFDIDKQLSIPITAGFTSIQRDKDQVFTYTYNYIPVKAGLKVFFSDTGSGFYGLGEVGAAFGTDAGFGTNFVFSPAIGYSWSNGLDLGAKYEGITQSGATLGYAGVRLAYGFKL